MASVESHFLFILTGSQLHLLDLLVGFPDELQPFQVGVAISVGHDRIMALEDGADITASVSLFFSGFFFCIFSVCLHES